MQQGYPTAAAEASRALLRSVMVSCPRNAADSSTSTGISTTTRTAWIALVRAKPTTKEQLVQDYAKKSEQQHPYELSRFHCFRLAHARPGNR